MRFLKGTYEENLLKTLKGSWSCSVPLLSVLCLSYEHLSHTVLEPSLKQLFHISIVCDYRYSWLKCKMLLLYIFLRQKEIFKFLCVIGLLPVKRFLEFLLTEALLICCKILSVVEQLVLWEVLCVAIIYVQVLHFFSSIFVWPHLP